MTKWPESDATWRPLDSMDHLRDEVEMIGPVSEMGEVATEERDTVSSSTERPRERRAASGVAPGAAACAAASSWRARAKRPSAEEGVAEGLVGDDVITDGEGARVFDSVQDVRADAGGGLLP